MCDEINRLNRNFMLGLITDKRRLHLVKWQHVTQLKTAGGPDIRDTRMANIVLLAKLGGNMVAGVDKIWASFESEIHPVSAVLETPAKGGDSTTWRGITKNLSHVHGGFGWTIGNVFDAWLSSDPLCLMVEDIDLKGILWTMADIIEPDGSWDVAKIRTPLPRVVLSQIGSYV